MDSLETATTTSDATFTHSYLLGDTVWVTGVVTIPPRDPITGGTVLFTGDRFRLMIQDPNDPEWGAITLVSDDTSLSKSTNAIDIALEGDSISVLGEVTEFRTLTQVNLLRVDTAFVFHGIGTVLPPRELPLSMFKDGTSPIWNDAEKYESALVTMRDLTVIDVSSAYFALADAQSNQIVSDDESNELFEAFNADNVPPVGAEIDEITGFMGTSDTPNTWELNPRGLSDIVVGIFTPSITTIRRSPVTPSGSEPVEVSAMIVDEDGTVASATLNYSVNDAPLQQLAMSLGTDDIWSATIPATGVDSAFVSHFIEAVDNGNNVSLEPPDTSANRNFYFALDRPITIHELQFTPYENGNSGYLDERITVDGIVTADRVQDFSEIYLQDGNAPWSGILLFFETSEDTALRRGDDILVSGRIDEFFGKTEIDSAEIVMLNSSGNPLPEAVPVQTADVRTVGALAEQYESMLVKLQNVSIVDTNSDAPSNFGEWEINEDNTATSGLLVDDKGVASGNVSYDNDVTSSPFGSIQLNLNDFFESITGVLDYTFGDFKLQPRNDDDFVGYSPVTSVERDESVIPKTFIVHQNYPNPFNPSTTIRYEIPSNRHVTVKIYSILGQEVATLVDELQDAGGYIVTFDSQKLASGVFFYRVSAGDLVAVKKMLLLK